MTDLVHPSTLRQQWLGYQAAAIVAMVALNVTNVIPVEVGAAVVGTAALIATRLLPSWPHPELRAGPFALVATAVMLPIGLFAPVVPHQVVSMLIMVPFVIVMLFIVWRLKVERPRVRWVAIGTLAVMLLVIGYLWIPLVTPAYTDMIFLHESAADVILDLRNPYTDAYSISTNPFAPEGAEYIGYAYPPMTMIPFAGADILFGDSRWASVLALIAVVVLLIRPWERMSRHQAFGAIAIALAIVVQPWVALVVYNGWTDAVTLPLLLAGALLWRRHPVLSAVLLGLAFGTKQYLILALPLLLAWSDSFRWKRTLIAGGVAALTLLPFVALDPIAFWNATLAGPLAAPIRLDSSGLAGLGLEVPAWLVAALAIGVAAWMGRAGGGSARFLVALAATCSIAFLTGYQAFMNYWFFVATVGVLGVAVSVPRFDVGYSSSAAGSTEASSVTVRSR